jgi:excisionase family DNA binding protein
MINDTNEDQDKAKVEVKDKERLISLVEASEIYGLSTSYLRQIARKGRLGAQKVGRDWVTTPADVEEYIRSRDKRGLYRDDISI